MTTPTRGSSGAQKSPSCAPKAPHPLAASFTPWGFQRGGGDVRSVVQPSEGAF